MAWGGDDDRRPEADEEEELDETVSPEMPPRPNNLP
jgi:hypothetical protein